MDTLPEACAEAESAPDGLGEELVGLSEALDEEASDCLVEGVLARVGRGAKGGGADLDHRDFAGGGNGGRAAAAAAGGEEHLAARAAGGGFCGGGVLAGGAEPPPHQGGEGLAPLAP